MTIQTVLVTGANGFLGNAVAKAFSVAGWKPYGLIRRESAAADLWKHEVVPIMGCAADPSFINNLPPIDVVAATTEDTSNYAGHFNDNIRLFKLIGSKNRSSGHMKPLVIFTSGCKDYGMTLRHGNHHLQPHTEDSPLEGPAALKIRTEMSLTIFNHKDDFDAVLTRPTTFYGSSGTYYAPLFALAQQAANAAETLTLQANPDSIMHGTHIHDVASAYVAVASAARQDIAGQVFNISSDRYETSAQVAAAVEKSYGIKIELFSSRSWSETQMDFVQYLMDFSQWVDSSKLRTKTGWKDCMPSFTEDFDRYRRVYEAFAKENDERVM